MRVQLRRRQIRATARLLKGAMALPGLPASLRGIRNNPLTAPLYRTLLGYNSVFATRADAETAIQRYRNAGHEHQANVTYHTSELERALPSDYAALYHLGPASAYLRNIYDLGGNVGNLYYRYVNYLSLPPDVTWTVQDLPRNMEFGRDLAKKREANHLLFSNDWSRASGCDVLIVCGALHYFDEPLSTMVARLPERPRRILVNRSPFTSGTPYFAVQDTGEFLVTCRINNMEDTQESLLKLGYRLIDDWIAPEFRIVIPGDPDHSVPHYFGFFLELKG